MSEVVTTDWKRQFPGEHYIPLIHRLINPPLYTVTKRIQTVSRQAQLCDINQWYRVGGIDPLKLELWNDVIVINVAIGTRKLETADEQITLAKSKGKKYSTLTILDPADPTPIEGQIDFYSEIPGVVEAPMGIDYEKPRSSTRIANYNELRKGVLRIKSISVEFFMWLYSRVNLLEGVFVQFPDWMEDVNQHIAQYLFKPYSTELYRYYDDFIKYWEWKYPPAVTRSRLYKDIFWLDRVKLWQFTDFGDAQKYIAVQTLPDGGSGKKSADLNLSMEPLEVFLTYFGEVVPPPIHLGDRLQTLFDNQALRDGPSVDGTHILRKLPRFSLLDVVRDHNERTLHVPGLSLPQDVWAHVKDDQGNEGWVAIYHPTRSTVYVQTL